MRPLNSLKKQAAFISETFQRRAGARLTLPSSRSIIVITGPGFAIPQQAEAAYAVPVFRWKGACQSAMLGRLRNSQRHEEVRDGRQQED
jgi:hypothetical protein